MIRFRWRKPLQAQPSSPTTALSVESDVPAVRGERARFIVDGARSLQSRMTSLLAAGLMLSVGAGMLAWYYTEALARPAAARLPAATSLREAAGGGITLPPFEPAASPALPRSTVSVPGALPVPPPTIAALLSPTSGQSSPLSTRLPDSLTEPSLGRAPRGLPPGYGDPPQPSPRQRALDRRLSGEVFASGRSDTSSDAAATDVGGGAVAAALPGSAAAQMPVGGHPGSALEALLRPSVLNPTRPQVLPTQRLLLPKGTFIDCTLQTGIDSTLPGMTTCVTATDTFGADGTIVLLERGTRLIGETRGEARQGEARVFVVWAEARTPSGVVVQLDSPGTDALGRSGLEGRVNRHFWQRFGAAALVSTIDGVVQSEAQSSSRGGTVVLDPNGSEDVLTEILRGTVNIPPTIRIHNGARIQVLVARDIDFRSVYELEPR